MAAIELHVLLPCRRQLSQLTYGLNFADAGSTPGVAGHLAVVRSHERPLLDQPQGGQDIGYVIEATDFSWLGK